MGCCICIIEGYLRSCYARAASALFLFIAIHSSRAFVPSGYERHSRSLKLNQTSQPTIDSSDETLLRQIDRQNDDEIKQLCSYLVSETITSAGEEAQQNIDTTAAYHSPITPVLSGEAISALRTTAQRYFEKRKESNIGAFGMEIVDLGELICNDTKSDVSWKRELNDALTQVIYPLVRSGWSTHDAFSAGTNALLTVKSATVVTGWGCPLTPFEGSSGQFVVHIDLGNNGQVANDAMGALYLESLVAPEYEIQSREPIVGPLSPGQMVVHRSVERTAAIVVPSDIHSLNNRSKSSLDTTSRRHILKAAESTRHFVLRLVLTTNNEAKTEREKHVLKDEADIDNKSSESACLIQLAEAWEHSVHLESAAVRVGADGIDDLALSLHKLAETRCKMAKFDEALNAIDKWAECGSLRSALAIEDMTYQHQSPKPSFDWIQTPADEATDKDTLNKRRNVAIKTFGDVRVFEPKDVSLLRAAADKHFARTAGQQTSRYTMQYEGNSEVHLDDLCRADPVLKKRIDQILQEKVYPLVRAAFREDKEEPQPRGSICVYDSIFVRYNAEKAKAAGKIGASQPLHQDGGIYSVNIALNDGFTGGGTFFEALTVGDSDGGYIHRPSAPGHAIIHKTTQRHAGAPTTSGVRDILVIFLTARQPDISETEEETWRVERAMRLTPLAKGLTRDKLIPCLKLAVSKDPTSHALPYALGVHLIQEGDMNDPSDARWEEICEGVEAFERSIELNPADARAHYNLGMAISDRHKYAMRTRRMHLLPPPQEAAESLINALETAIELEMKCDKAGCSNGLPLADTYITLGDFVLRLKNFELARTYLNQVEEVLKKNGDINEDWAQSMLQQVASMLDYIHENEAPILK